MLSAWIGTLVLIGLQSVKSNDSASEARVSAALGAELEMVPFGEPADGINKAAPAAPCFMTFTDF